MGFNVVYVADGDINTVRKVKYVDRIKNFAQLAQPYNKMKMINVPAIAGVYNLDYESPDEEMELVSITVTCSGYGENDYYNLWVNDELWFDTWFPTEVKEGLYAGTSTYVYVLPPKSKFEMKFVNITGTAKKIWLGVRMLRNPAKEERKSVDMLNVFAVEQPASDITSVEMEPVGT